MIYFHLPSVQSERMTLIEIRLRVGPVLLWQGCLGDKVHVVPENQRISGRKTVCTEFF